MHSIRGRSSLSWNWYALNESAAYKRWQPLSSRCILADPVAAFWISKWSGYRFTQQSCNGVRSRYSGSPIAAFRLIITKVEKEEKGGRGGREKALKPQGFCPVDRLLHLFLVANPFHPPLWKLLLFTYVSNGIFQDQNRRLQKFISDFVIRVRECNVHSSVVITSSRWQW